MERGGCSGAAAVCGAAGAQCPSVPSTHACAMPVRSQVCRPQLPHCKGAQGRVLHASHPAPMCAYSGRNRLNSTNVEKLGASRTPLTPAPRPYALRYADHSSRISNTPCTLLNAVTPGLQVSRQVGCEALLKEERGARPAREHMIAGGCNARPAGRQR